MATIYGTYNAGRGQNPVGQGDGSANGGHVRVYRERIDLSLQAAITTSDTIYVGNPSKGEQFLYGVLKATASMGSSTLAIGASGATGKYRAAAIFTAVDTPTLFGAGASGLGGLDKLGADETVIVTIGAASLPTSGILTVELYFAQT